jgi:hypothetical protein
MSTLRVDTIYNRARTISSNVGVKPPLNDDTTLIPSTAWVQDELDSLLTQDRTVSGDWTLSGDTAITGELDLSSATSLSFPSTIFPIAMGNYDTRSKPNGALALTYQAGVSMTAVKNEVGSATFTLVSPTTSASQFTVLPIVHAAGDDVQPSCRVFIHSASSFSIVSEMDAGTNLDAEVRFLVFGKLA